MRRTCLGSAVAVLMVLSTPGASYSQLATFDLLWDRVYESWTANEVNASADGRVVIGAVNTPSGKQACAWTKGSGLAMLGDLDGGVFESHAFAASGDGSVIVGYGSTPEGQEAFRWTAAGGMESIGDLPGGATRTFAFGVSADGSVVVGGGNSLRGFEAFRWTAATSFLPLNDLAGGSFSSNGTASSTNGDVLVGNAHDATGGVVMRWTPAEGMVSLGNQLPGFSGSGTALDVSPDGSTIVGWAAGGQPFRWTEGSGLEYLGDLPGGDLMIGGSANAVSGDGRIVVGRSRSDLGVEAFVWTPEAGMVPMAEMLQDQWGLDLDGWRLTDAHAISDDGTVIVGTARKGDLHKVFRAEVPEPGSLSLLALGALAILRRRRHDAGTKRRT